jgi:hypothetical protein
MRLPALALLGLCAACGGRDVGVGSKASTSTSAASSNASSSSAPAYVAPNGGACPSNYAYCQTPAGVACVLQNAGYACGAGTSTASSQTGTPFVIGVVLDASIVIPDASEDAADAGDGD